MIADERASILETFEELTDEQWEVRSLCGHWSVRQVLGHLVIAGDPPMGRFLLEMAKAAGRFDLAQDRLAKAEAARPTAELLAAYRARVHKRFAPPGFGPRAPLTDVVLHSFDVRIPLGLSTERPAERYVPCLELLLDRRALIVFVPRGRPKLRWVATDLAWEHGTGDEVQGTMADLACAASGREARLGALGGPGQLALTRWLDGLRGS